MIIIYTKEGCPWCIDALAYLDETGLEFENREVRGNETYMQEMVEKSGQSKAPTLDVDGEILADTDREAIKAFLTEKGLV